MSAPTPAAPAPVTLHCLGGGAAPPDMAADLRAVLELPEGARRHFWEALGPSLAEPIPDALEGLLTRFTERHSAPDVLLARAIKACRFLLQAAARVDLDRARFVEDLGSLAGDVAPRLAEVLLPGFDKAKQHVRAGLLQRTLVEHGRYVEAVDWRIEEIVSSSHGEAMRHRVALVTLQCREGERRERISLYLGVEALEELAKVHARMRAPGGAP